MNTHKVYIVGAGPGEPDLITVRALRILRQADVVVYDYLVDKRLLEETRPGAELIYCDRPGKKIQLVIRKFKEGKKVIRLKNGSPSLFSRLAEELEALIRENVPFEVVAGITAAEAASSLSGIPLTSRRFSASCIFATGHEDPAKQKSYLDWPSLAKSGTIVFYMAVENIAKIAKILINAGKPAQTPAAIIQNVSLSSQKVLTAELKDIAAKAKKAKVKPPAIIIIGEVVKFEKKFNRYKKGKRILFTGLSDKRYFLRDNFVHLPLIKIEPLTDYSVFDAHLLNICSFDWVVFGSRYGVEYFFKRLKVLGKDIRDLADLRFAVVGGSTKNKLLEFGIIADIVPELESSQGLLQTFNKERLEGKKIFLPRSDLSDKGLEKGLRQLGAEVISCVAYRNVMPSDLPDIELGSFDEIYFTSPSTVRNFKRRYKKIPASVKIRCIGDVTLKEAKRCQLLV